MHEWAIVDHVFRSDPVLGPVLLDCLFILREEKREGQQELKVRNRPDQLDLQLVFAQGLDAQAADGLLAGIDGFGVYDLVEVEGHGRLGLRVQASSVGVDKVIGRDRLAVGPLGVSQDKSICLAPVSNLGALGQGQLGLLLFVQAVEPFLGVQKSLEGSGVSRQ